MSLRNKMLWEFEGYRLDAAQRVLLRGGEVVSLTPKVFDTLLALVESRGRVLEKDELLKNTRSQMLLLCYLLATRRKPIEQFGRIRLSKKAAWRAVSRPCAKPWATRPTAKSIFKPYLNAATGLWPHCGKLNCMRL